MPSKKLLTIQTETLAGKRGLYKDETEVTHCQDLLIVPPYALPGI